MSAFDKMENSDKFRNTRPMFAGDITAYNPYFYAIFSIT
jgi:hypothetical protein